MATYTVILDACVMYPAPLRSYLLYLAQTGLYRARWADQIHDEWIRNVIKNNFELDNSKLERTRKLMDAHMPGCLIEGYELSAIHPDMFLTDMLELNTSAAIQAAQRQRGALKSPSMSVDDYLDCLLCQKSPVFVSKLRTFANIL